MGTTHSRRRVLEVGSLATTGVATGLIDSSVAASDRSNLDVRPVLFVHGGLTDDLVDRGPDHVALVINRDREWWGDVGPHSDSLLIDGTDVITPELAPLEDGIISPMIFDAGADGQSDLSAPVPAFESVPFLTGVDLFVPAGYPPEDAVSIVTRPRGRGGLERRMTVPNWPSDQRRLVVHVPDHGQARESAAERPACKA